MTEIHPSSLGRFVRSVAVLASSAEEQLAFLVSVGIPEQVDELALEFDDGQLLVRQFRELQWVTAAFQAKVSPLNALLNEMSGEARAELWTSAGLRNSSEWSKVRLLAKDLLFAI